MPKSEPPAATLTVPQAAAALGISTRTAYYLIAEDKFPVPVIRLGRTIRVPRAALNNLAETGTSKNEGEL